MRQFSLSAGAACLLFSLALCVRADDADDKICREIIAKAIKAQGGEANIKKSRTAHVKSTGTIDFMNNLKFTAETYTQYPDKFKNTIELNVNNMNITVNQVYNGKDFWVNAAGNLVEFKDKKDLAEIKENVHLERLGDLVTLGAKGITLAPLGEVKVDKEDAVGVRVSSNGHRDLNLYFSKKTGLLVKTEARIYDLQNKQEVTQEKLMSDFKDVDGVMMPHKLIIFQDGKRYVTAEVSDATFVDRHDDSIFAKP